MFCFVFQMLLVALWLLLCPSPVSPDVSYGNSTQKIIGQLARQLMLQQYYIEEKTRSEGDSGIKQVRYTHDGATPFDYPTHAGDSFASIHDHSPGIRMLGMGESVVVLNGIEFRTRHNDFEMKMPSTTSSRWKAVENIPFPDVPPEILQITKVREQVQEMKEWFKAWQEQNHTVRDYRPYFKPVLCYLEGAWTKAVDQVEEPFISPRHFIDAKYWQKLEDQLRFLSYSGGKHNLENFAYLPRVIFNITEDGIPIYAQWNYRILCHPVHRDIPLNCLNVVDDLKSRIVNGQRLDEFALSRKARFTLNSTCLEYDPSGQLLESLMREIPGKDNYGGNLRDYGYAGLALDPYDGQPLNTAFYHRKYNIGKKDSSGFLNRYRGFSDRTVFMAMTSQKEVLGMNFEKCKKTYSCLTEHQRWTYAIPLEIIYMTPLSKWNPFKLKYRGNADTYPGKLVSSKGQKGSLKKPYYGTNSRKFYQTPSWFYHGDEVGRVPADTSPKGIIYVLDQRGKPRKMTASGHRIIFPSISGVGLIRQRYPIAPVYGEGSTVWKELEALKQLVLSPKENCHLLYEKGGKRCRDMRTDIET